MVRSIFVSSNPSTCDSFGGATTSATFGPNAYKCRRYASMLLCVGDVAPVDGATIADGACCAQPRGAIVLRPRITESVSALFTWNLKDSWDELLRNWEWPAKSESPRSDLKPWRCLFAFVLSAIHQQRDFADHLYIETVMIGNLLRAMQVLDIGFEDAVQDVVRRQAVFVFLTG